jgi:hypothetical protein
MNSKCQKCGAELLPQTNFCRQCGASLTDAAGLDEQPTSILDQDLTATTKRLDPRDTAPRTVDSIPLKKARSGKVFVVVALFLTICLAVTIAVFVKNRKYSASAEGLMYPGASKVMDIVSEGGGRAVQLETSDDLSKVENWYRESMNADKVIRLTEGSIVIKNEKTTATLVHADKKTSILLKIIP